MSADSHVLPGLASTNFKNILFNVMLHSCDCMRGHSNYIYNVFSGNWTPPSLVMVIKLAHTSL